MKTLESAVFNQEEGRDVMLILSRVYHRSILSLEAHVGIPAPRWRLLFLLNMHGACTQKELTAMLKIDPASITRPLNTLQEHGLVERARDEDDNRLSRVRLTRAGLAAVRAGMKRRRHFLAGMLRGLSRAEVLSIVRLLSRMEKNLAAGAAAPGPAPFAARARAP